MVPRPVVSVWLGIALLDALVLGGAGTVVGGPGVGLLLAAVAAGLALFYLLDALAAERREASEAAETAVVEEPAD
jgi:hypothetical protein